MNLILHIDCSGPEAWVVLAREGIVLAASSNDRQQDHAAFLHPAIQKVLQGADLEMRAIQAVAVCVGPGSYTGIRVGMAAAKGLSYALGIPLITFNALELAARSLRDAAETDAGGNLPLLYCPMIDARRMEVFTAVYDRSLQIVMEPQALILTPESYVKILLNNRVVFSGTGAAKWQRECIHANAVFSEEKYRDRAMACLSWEKAQRAEFADLIYADPLYLKEFYTAAQGAS